MPDYRKLYTPQDSAVVFIDHQPQMIFGVSSIERSLLINNVTLFAKVAKEFNVPVVLTAVETESFSGYVWPQLLDVFPEQPVVERVGEIVERTDPANAKPADQPPLDPRRAGQVCAANPGRRRLSPDRAAKYRNRSSDSVPAAIRPG